MPVKKVKPPVKKRKLGRANQAGSRTASARIAEKNALAGIVLPDAPRGRVQDPSKYVGLLYGRAGIGKTTWAASWPDVLMLSFERVSKGLKDFHDFNWENGGVTSWPIALRALELLEEHQGRFATVVVDTGDTAYRRCLEYVCSLRGITHPEDEGWGKGWNEVRREYESFFKRLQDTGRGIWIISHSREQEVTKFSGSKFTRIVPTLSGQAYDLFKGFTDLTFYAEFMTDKKGDERRVLITAGDELIDAKNNLDLPKFVELSKEDGYRVLTDRTEDIGPDLVPSNKTTQTATNLVRQSKSKPKASAAQPKRSAVLKRRKA